MSDALKAAGRATGLVGQAAAGTVRKAFPTITRPGSGDKITGGTSLAVTVSTNRPDVAHTVTLRRSDGTGTPASAGVTFPLDGSGVPTSPGTASVPVPAAEAQDTDYILQVTPADPPGGTSHSIILTVPGTGGP